MTIFTPKYLTHNNPNTYSINSRKLFGTGFITTPTPQELSDIMTFAWNMTFGKVGEHRQQRTGGTAKRSNLAIFQDVVTGKLGELGFYHYCQGKVTEISGLDLACYQRGKWDTADFEVVFAKNRYTIAVKTTKSFGNLLLLEQADWQTIDGKAYYTPNLPKGLYDFIVFCRVETNLDSLFKQEMMSLYNDPTRLSHITQAMQVTCEVSGHLTNQDLVTLINGNYLIRKGEKLNTTIMDATNYYVQCGCMRPMKYRG